MGRSLQVIAFSACFTLAACRAPEAYGPASDDRLEAAVSERTSNEGAEVGSLKCSDLDKKLRDAKSDDIGEGDRLQALLDTFNETKDRFTKIDEAVARNPDLLYSEQSETIKGNLEGCRTTLAEVRSELDRFVREIADLPVIQEVQGSKTVSVARLDYAIMRAAIGALDSDDKDVLLTKVDSAEKKVGAAKAAPKSGKKR